MAVPWHRAALRWRAPSAPVALRRNGLEPHGKPGDRRKLTEREEQESEEMGIHHFQVIREKNLRTNQSLFFQDTHEKCIDLFLCSLAQKSATQKQCIHHYVLIFEWCQVILDLEPRFQSFPVSPNIISPWLYHTQTIVCHLSRYIYIWFASSGLAQRWHFTYTHIPVARSIIYWHFSAPVVMSIHKFLQMPDASETICLLIFKHPQGCFFKSTWYTSRTFASDTW